MIKTVTKRDGSVVPFDAQKIRNWLVYGFKGNDGVEEVLTRVINNLYEGITTDLIQTSCINVCLSYKTTKYSNIASMFLIGNVYKEVGIPIVNNKPQINFVDRFKSLTDSKAWMGLEKYTEQDIERLASVIDYSKDFEYEYISLKRWYDSLARRDVTTNKILELPQETWLGVSMANHVDSDDRVNEAIAFYNYTKTREINIPTPMAVNLRTGKSNGVSCCVITAGDTRESLSTANHIAYMMTSNGAGIGINYECRSRGDIVGDNKCLHGGKLPQYKMLKAVISSVSQGSRGGAVTINYNCLDPEFFDLLLARLPTTIETLRLNTVDYNVLYNDSCCKAINNNKQWILISKTQAPLLHQYFLEKDCVNFDKEFTRIYPLVQSGELKGTIVSARDMFYKTVDVAVTTGNIYISNITNINKYTPYKEPIRSSNLCNEITLPTRPYNSISEINQPFTKTSGLTALCFLMAIDVGKVLDNSTDYEDFKQRYMDIAYTVLKAVDNNVDNLDYPSLNIETSAKHYRSVGIGITNFAYYLAAMGLLYSSQEARNEGHRLAELHYYSICQASVRLAQERGKCGAFDDTLMAQGILPVDNYSKYVDENHTQSLELDWDTLRHNVVTHGTRHSCFVSYMPSEQSSKLGNSYKSILPMREGITYTSDSKNTVLFIGPRYEELAPFYESAFDISQLDLYKMYGVFSKFTDQAASYDTYIDLSKQPHGKVSLATYTKNVLYAFSLGVKTFYYVNTIDGNGEVNKKEETCVNCDV